ncbi:MAG: hypothetical protein NTX03_01775, partial [Bacteroidetes bacterium]|nr:hypothetical protein [Bacteroidota bacterium]
MLKRILFVFVPILLLLLVSCSEKKTKEQLLIRKWKIEVLKDEGRITPTNKVDFIAFTHDHKFIINTKDAKLKHTGQWYLVGDSLTLSFTPPPNNVAADSSVVNIKGDENSVTLYNNHEVIGSIDNGAVHPFQKKSTFHISKLDKEKLAFATTNQEWNLIYREEKLIGTGFSWGGFMNGFIGILGLTLIGVMLSAHRRRINWALIIKAVLLQFLFAFCILKIPAFGYVFGSIAGFFVTILEFTRAGSTFLFGGLVSNVNSYGFIFVFQVLPTIIFVAAFTSALFYLNVLQRIVFGFAWVMKRVMGLSGAESLASAANIFVGQTEAPLVIKPYIPSMTRSETMALMTGGMAHISGGVLAAYIGFLGGADPEQQRLFATHLLSASIMTAPGTFFAAKLMMPETEEFNK